MDEQVENRRFASGRAFVIFGGLVTFRNLMERHKWSILFSLFLLISCFGDHVVAQEKTCPVPPGNLTAWTDQVKSANFGVSSYSNNQRCSWLIVLARGSRVRLTRESFELETRTSQCWDFLKVYDGGDKTAPLLGEYCGSDEFPEEVTSTGRAVFLVFETDSTNSLSGFHLTYTGVCSGGTINVPITETGWIESPLYPDPYPASMNCSWVLETQDGYRVDADFETFSLTSTNDCNASRIQFFDGSSSTDTKLGEFCGSVIEPVGTLHDVSSTGNVLYLHFQGAADPGQGFRLSYSADMLACTLSSCQNGASCRNIDLDFACDCAPGWDGRVCDVNLDDCTPWPCGEHGASCADLVNGFTCTCLAGFEGARCDIDIDDCVNHQCQNGGTCVDGNNEYSCICMDAFMGPRCSQVNHCVTDVPICQHGGTCQTMADSYSCVCAAGYEGNQCETDIDECSSSPCLNGGTCSDEINGYICSCLGYSGVNCQSDIDECASGPCQHGSTCVDMVNGYQCTCLPGYEGTNCQTDIDECASSPCQHGSTCLDEINRFQCSCLPGYEGIECQNETDECASGPCQHGSTCVDMVNGYQCTCLPGYEGTNCESDMDECASSPCQHGSTCIDEINGFQCSCLPGYDGIQCQNDIDECASGPCQHDSTCVDMVNSYQCTCLPGYEGTNCQTDIDECASSPCQHGSTCLDEINRFQCSCLPGYEGIECQNDIDECASGPCQHGSTCIDMVNGYQCTCLPGYEGTNCESDMDECASSPCQHGSTCLDEINGFQCSCLPGYDGIQCQNDIDECASGPCQHDSTCVDMVNGYQCTCLPGYEGTNCQTDIDECASSPCQHGSTCLDEINRFQCSCLPGYEGIECQNETDECASGPCQHGSTCVDMVNGYQCTCLPGYEGTNCQTDIDECASSPCQHGSTCIDEINRFQCSCLPGYDGIHCQNDIDECSSSPCMNDGQCMDGVNGYQCRCQGGYTGTNCKTDINECSSNPCINGGTCGDLINRYQCHCLEEFTGDHCEVGVVKLICEGGADGIKGSGLVWDDTDPGRSNTKRCPEGVLGNASRSCNENGEWNNPDLSQCVSPAFVEISGKVELLKSGNASAGDVLDLANSLQNITKIPGSEGEPGDQIYPGDMDVAINSLSVITEVVSSLSDIDVDTAKDLTKACAGTVNNVVDESQVQTWKNANDPEKVAASVTAMMSSTETMASVVSQQQSKQLGSEGQGDAVDSSLSIKDKNIELEIAVFRTNETNQQEAFMGGASSEVGEDGLASSDILLPSNLLDGAKDGNGSSPNFVGIMKGKFSSVGELFSLGSENSDNQTRKDYVNTDVLSLKVLGVDAGQFQNLETPLMLVFKHKKDVEANSTSCVFLNMSARGSEDRWSDFGCELQSSNDTHTVCTCSHLTNFAILMDVHGSQKNLPDVHNTALSVLSYIGGTLSILGCFFSIAIYKFFRLKSDRIRVHMHLAAAIGVAQLIFLVGIERNEIAWVCKMIAVVLHYSLTAMFCWMLVEGIQLYLALVHVFGSSSHIKKYYLLGWGAPVIIVGISFGVFFMEYGEGKVCWMSQKMLLIIFVPTVAILIILNTAVLVIVLKVMMTSMTAREKSKDSDVSQVKTGLKAALVLLPLLGLTWVFGFLSVNEHTLVFTYLFAVCNSLQGLFFFIAHCVMNIEVKKAYERRYGRKKGLHSMTTSTAPLSSRNQSSVSRRRSDASTTELTKSNTTINTVSGGYDKPAEMKDTCLSKDPAKPKGTAMNNSTASSTPDHKKTATEGVKINDIQCLIKNSENVNDEEKGMVKGAKVAMETIVSKDTNLRMDGSNIS